MSSTLYSYDGVLCPDTQAILLIEYEILARVIFSPRSGRWPRWLHVCLPPEPPAQRDRISDLQDDLALLRRELAEMRQRQVSWCSFAFPPTHSHPQSYSSA